jgi:LuxR family maltose regulon positive regulatory protein
MIKRLFNAKHQLPVLRDTAIERPRLQATFTRAFEMPLTLVSAPPGFGKTTAALIAVHTAQRTGQHLVAWLSIDEYDNEPGRFWHYFLAALNTAVPGLGERLAQSDDAMPVQALLPELLHEIADDARPIMFVLDDYHFIVQSEIHESVALLVEHVPPNLQLMVITRADPPLPLHRLRARGQLHEIRAADLRFSQSEAAGLLNAGLRLGLTDREVISLAAQTEGWATGLQLAGLALQGTAADEDARRYLIERLVHSNRYIPEYLAEEVLAQQPLSVQTFLLQTSILRRLCAPLCAAVTGKQDSAAILDDLIRRNLLLVSLPGEGLWFRYHQLFADLLQGQLRQQQPDLITSLHGRAAAWYESQGDTEAAVDHALLAEDYAYVVQLLDAHAGMFAMQGRVLTIEGWLGRLPDEWRRRLGRGQIAYAWALLVRGRYGEVEPYLNAAEATVSPDDQRLNTELHTIRAALADIIGQSDTALSHAQAALASARPDDLFTQAIAQTALGGALRVRGDVEAAIVAYEQAIPLCRAAHLRLPEMLSRAHLGYLYITQGRLRQAESATRPVIADGVRHPAAGAVYVSLAHVILEWNRIAEASDLLQQALELANKSGHNATLLLGHILLARLHRMQNDIHAAQTALDTAAAQMVKGVPTWIATLLHTERVRLWLEQDAITTAEQYLSTTGELNQAAGHVTEVLSLMWARIHYHRGRYAEAEAIIAEIVHRAEARERQGRVIEARILQALICDVRGDEPEALDNLEAALQLAEPETYISVFIEAGSALAPLLLRIEGDFARQLFDAFPAAVRQSAMTSADLPEPLTEREIDVLRLMEQGLTYQQIADALVVSINTVRHHVKGIYSKLYADSRTRAIERARTLRLI